MYPLCPHSMVTVWAELLKQWKPEGHCSLETLPEGWTVEFCAKTQASFVANTNNKKLNTDRWGQWCMLSVKRFLWYYFTDAICNFTFQCCIHTPNLSHCGFCYLYFRKELVATRNQMLLVRSFWSFRCLIHSFPKLSSLKLHEGEAAVLKKTTTRYEGLKFISDGDSPQCDDSYGITSSTYVFSTEMLWTRWYVWKLL